MAVSRFPSLPIPGTGDTDAFIYAVANIRVATAQAAARRHATEFIAYLVETHTQGPVACRRTLSHIISRARATLLAPLPDLPRDQADEDAIDALFGDGTMAALRLELIDAAAG